MTSWTRPGILDPDRREEAHDYLVEYFTGTAYSGSYFDVVGDSGTAASDRVTSDDLVALAMLSVPVQGAAARELLEGERARRITELLARIPVDADLTMDAGRAVLLSSDVLDLWNEVRGVKTFGPVRTSKLLARKRPRLIPIYDRHIKEQFGADHDGDQWRTWVDLFRDQRLVAHLRDLREGAGLSQSLSLLRVLDVVVWMKGKSSAAPEVPVAPDLEL